MQIELYNAVIDSASSDVIFSSDIVDIGFSEGLPASTNPEVLLRGVTLNLSENAGIIIDVLGKSASSGTGFDGTSNG